MALSQPRELYGIHNVTFYDRSNGLPYGILRVLGSSSLNITGETVSLNGGSSPYAWDTQGGAITPEMSLNFKEYPNFLFQVLFGATVTEAAAPDTDGDVTTLTNVLGTSAQDDSTGIASVGLETDEEAELKFGKYIVKVVTTTAVDVYGLTNVDFSRGTDEDFEDDTLKLTATPIIIPDSSGGTVSLPDFGVEFTAGSSSVAMTIGDTAEFTIKPPYTNDTDILVGSPDSCIPEFGAFLAAQRKGDGTMWTIDCFRVTALGFPLGLEEKAFAESEITANLSYDAAAGGIFRLRRVKPITGGCI
ncbi:MAG: hypothetical protein RTU92_10865 [Candidatus Thorarchaeota archaeon]